MVRFYMKATMCTNRSLYLLVALVLLLSLAVPIATADTLRDVLYQISTIDALMEGLFDGCMSVDQLKKHGDFGLGTFDKLDGEMVVVDGIVYQATPDGVIHKPASTVTTPFAAVTFMDNDKTAIILSELTLPKLQEYLDSMLPSRNLFYAIRIDGNFTRVKTRSVPRQSKPYRHLVDVTKQQTLSEFTNVEGTIVALKCPYFVKGVNVPGYHMHFITSDRKRGGHLLDCSVKSGTIAFDTTTEFELSLPQDESFYRTDFSTENQEDLEKVEKTNR